MRLLRRALAMTLAMSLFAAGVSMQPASAKGKDAGIDSIDEIEDAVEDVLAGTPVDDLVDETAADVKGLDVDESADVVVELETDDGDTVEIPSEADEPIVIENAEGDTLEVELPGKGDDAEVTDDGSVVYEDALPDTDIVVQAQDNGGVRVMTVIDGTDAPTSFDFPVKNKKVRSLRLMFDGSVAMLDASREIIDVVPAPWAYDNEGNDVPAWYTIDGSVLTLNVHHSAASAYPIVADPCWSCAWNWTIEKVANNWPSWLAGFGAGTLVRLTCYSAYGTSVLVTSGGTLAGFSAATLACNALAFGASAATGAVVRRA